MIISGRAISTAATSCLLLWTGVSAAQPDLELTGLVTSAIVTDGQTLAIGGSIGVDISNKGDVNVVDPFVITAFEDQNANGVYDAATDVVLGTVDAVSGLAAGDTLATAVPLSGNVTFKGNLIYVLADSGGAITESDESNNIGNSGELSVFEPPPLGPLNPVLEWSWTSSAVIPDALNVMMTPSVIDLNNDGVPDVVFGATSSRGGARVEIGYLRALNGNDGSELFTVTDNTLRVNTASSIATGDIDGDNQPEIIACDASGRQLIAFEHDGTFKWRSVLLEAVNWGAPALADLDEDGTPEIIIGRQVLDNNGVLLDTGTAGRASQSDIGPISVVADVDLDGEPEVVAGNTVYDYDSATGLSVSWTAPLADGHNAIGDFDDDSFPEVVLVTSGQVYLLEHDGSVKWGPVSIPGGGAGGPPTIADYDADGEPEVGVAGASRYAVFETDGSLKWAAVTQDSSSNRTGSSVFDFEGDGAAEVVYRDELFLRICRGTDGSVLFQVPMSSCTWHEYVLVADVDADGNAEIVAVANNNCGFGAQRGVFVYGAQEDNWVATRQIWNQHSYHITNVNADGSIPQVEANNWQVAGLNNYRSNEFGPGEQEALNAPDLVPSWLRFDQTLCPDSVSITARTGNGGSLFAPAGVDVSFYQGDPSAGGSLLGTVQTSILLDPGEFEDVAFERLSPASGSQDIYVVADDDGTGTGSVSEGFEDNNVHHTVEEFCNQPPNCNADGPYVAECAGPNTSVTLDGAGSSDPDGDVLNFLWTGPFSGGTANGPGPTVLFGGTGQFTVDLEVSDGQATSMCSASVTVEDTLSPVVSCNSPATIIPPDAPIVFTATAEDQCEGQVVPQIAAYDCFKFTKKGKRIDKTESCSVDIAGNTVTILDSGGVGDNIQWTVEVTDGSGNTTTEVCSLAIVNPNSGK